MKRKLIKLSPWLMALVFLAFAATVLAPRLPAAENDGVNQPKVEDGKLVMISKLTSQILDRNHYRKQPDKVALSQRIFDEYFRILDSQKLYFTKQDLAQFLPERDNLAERIFVGDSAFAYKVYQVYCSRVELYSQFAEKMLAEPIDFTVAEEMEVDRRKSDWAEDLDALRSVWRQKLKNDVLYYRLLMRSLKEDGVDAATNSWDDQTPEEKVAKRLKDIQINALQQDQQEVLGLYLTAFALAYGPHSSYFAPSRDKDFEISMSLSLTGIGATLSTDGGFVKIIELVPGGPADRSGELAPGDRIIAVAQDGQLPVDVIDMSISNAVKLIRGEENTKVTLTIIPGEAGKSGAPKLVTITRAKVTLVDSAAKGGIQTVGDQKIGIIKVPSFYMDYDAARRGDPNFKSVSGDVEKILNDFAEQGGVDAIILDFRGNGGGSLQEAVRMANLFIPNCPAVQLRNQKGVISVYNYTGEPTAKTDAPMIILTDKLSASASEIVAGALKDQKRAVVVGDTRTFGKGTVLDVIGLERLLRYIGQTFPSGSVKLETAMFYRVNGSSVQLRGIEADIVLPSAMATMEIGEEYAENNLPWDQVDPVNYRLFDPRLDEFIPILAAKSKARIEDSEKFANFNRVTNYLNELRQKNTISLNEEERWKDFREQRKLRGAVSEESEIDEISELIYPRRNVKREDIQLEEALLIAADLAKLANEK